MNILCIVYMTLLCSEYCVYDFVVLGVLCMLRPKQLLHIQPSKINSRLKKFFEHGEIFVEFRFRISNQNFLTLPQSGDVVR